MAASTQPGATTRPDRLVRRLTIGFCLVALVLGAFEAWTSRFEMNPDGIQYLDNAAAYRQGDFQNALNTQWSPLYPWLIATASAIARPSRMQDFELAHAVNLVIFALSLASFLYFMRPLRASTAGATSLLLLGYAAFLYCSLDLTHLRYVTPDLLVNCFVFLVAGLLIRIANGNTTLGLQLALGAALGLGYLAKAPFLPIGIFCLLLAFFFTRKRALAALAVFFAVSAPYAAALSYAKHHFTIGDSAKLNLAWHVDGLPNTNWQGDPSENGHPPHPTRQLAVRPAIFEFREPIGGTYPPWYDPSYWNAGVQIGYHTRQVMHALGKQIRLYGYLTHHRQLPLVFALLALLMLSSDRRRILTRLKSVWPLLVLGAIPFAMYAPVHAEGRYLAPFFVLLWTAGFACVLDEKRASFVIALTAALLMCVESLAAVSKTSSGDPPARLHFDIARDLQALGIKPGDRVAMVSGNLPYNWAYLAGTRVTLQISFTGETSQTREAEWNTARSILATQQATLLVAPATDGVTNQPGWIRLATPSSPTTNVFAYPIHALAAY